MTATSLELLNLEKALKPGLVYDDCEEKYIPYLRSLNYSDEQLSKILQETIKCKTSISQAQLNYPSFMVKTGEKVQKFTRTVTNVGEARSVYKVKVNMPSTINVTVKPSKLRFTKVNQKITYEVTFNMAKHPENSFVEGSITWISESGISNRSLVMAICE